MKTIILRLYSKGDSSFKHLWLIDKELRSVFPNGSYRYWTLALDDYLEDTYSWTQEKCPLGTKELEDYLIQRDLSSLVPVMEYLHSNYISECYYKEFSEWVYYNPNELYDY